MVPIGAVVRLPTVTAPAVQAPSAGLLETGERDLDVSAVDSAAELGARQSARDRAVAKAAGATVLARLIATIATVATLAVAAKSLSVAELGVVAVLTLLTVFLGFGDFGLGTLLMTRLPAAQAKGDAEGSRRIVATTLSTLLTAGSVIGIAGVATVWVIPWPDLLGAERLAHGEVRASVIAFFVCGAVAIPGAVGGRILSAVLRSASSQFWLSAGSVGALGATVACGALHLEIWAYVVAIAGVPAAVSLVQTWWVLFRSHPYLRPGSLRVPLATVGEFLRAGSLFAIMTVSAGIAYSIDSLVVSSVLDSKVAAVFAVAARLFGLVGTTIGLAGQQMWSALADAIHRGDREWVHKRYRQVLVLSTAITTVACAFLVAVGRPVTRIWVGDHLVPPNALLIALGLYTVVSTVVTQASYLLAANEDVRTFAILGVVMAVVNLVASVLLTQAVGITGPILGSLVGIGAVMVVPLLLLVRRQLRDLAVTS